MRIVLDTNIYIAAALHEGLSAQIIKTLTETPMFTIIASQEIMDELREKLLLKFKWSKTIVEIFVDSINKIADIANVNAKVDLVKRDPEDNKILECAISGDADLIITLDQDLIKLKKVRHIAIVHPKTLSWIFPQYFKNKG